MAANCAASYIPRAFVLLRKIDMHADTMVHVLCKFFFEL